MLWSMGWELVQSLKQLCETKGDIFAWGRDEVAWPLMFISWQSRKIWGLREI